MQILTSTGQTSLSTKENFFKLLINLCCLQTYTRKKKMIIMHTN